MTDAESHDAIPSKSQRKREAQALQELGERLVDLSPSLYARIDLPDELRDAVDAARSIHKHGGRKRQLQFIGKLMRNLDADPIRDQLEAFDLAARGATQSLHRVEEWRERLLAEGDSAIDALLVEYPDADRQRLRHFVRTATREKNTNQPPRAARQLFRYLRELFAAG